MNELKGKVTAFRWEQKDINRRIKISIEEIEDDIDGEDNRITIYPVENSSFWNLMLGDSVNIKIEKE